jgi:hypothetical protein
MMFEGKPRARVVGQDGVIVGLAANEILFSVEVSSSET